MNSNIQFDGANPLSVWKRSAPFGHFRPESRTPVSKQLAWENIPEATQRVISTPMLSDSLDACGYRNQVLDGTINGLDSKMRAVGRAATLEFVPVDVDSDYPYDDAIDFIDSLQPGALIVIATSGSVRSAYWGELFSAAAIGRGAVGTVCDSFVRDSPGIRGLGYPVFSGGTRPIDFRARMRIVASTQVTCGGVAIRTGDLVAADADGVVAVPVEVEHEVLERAVTRATAERHVLDDLRAGALLREVWQRYGVL